MQIVVILSRPQRVKKLNFLTHVIITIIQTRCIYGNNMCFPPIYWLGCLKSDFIMKIWYPTKLLQNVAIIYWDIV